MRLRVVGLTALCLVGAGCGSSSPSAPGSPKPTGIVFVAGNKQTDTIQAVLTQALVVRIASALGGESPAHQVVQLQSVFDSTGSPEAYIESLTQPTPLTFFAESADASGQVNVVIVLGVHSGRARIDVKVPVFGFEDTATFTVLPGNPVSLSSTPHDTAVYPPSTVPLHSSVLDRNGNPRTDAVSYAVQSGPGTVSGSTAHVTGLGVVTIIARAQVAQDTIHVSGVPTGTIAGASDSGGIVMVHIDGSGYKHITSTQAGTVRWAPNGTSLVFDQTQYNGSSGAGPLLQSVKLDGTLSTLDNSNYGDVWPTYARDGSYIYYVKYYANQIWRVHPDGTGDSAVFMATPENSAPQFPGVSPDGSAIAYVAGGGSNQLKVLTVSTGTTVTLPVTAYAVAWSPTSNVIAYVTPGLSMETVNADGTGNTPIATGPFGAQFDWSPDGQWIIARNLVTNELTLINVASKTLVPLGYIRTIGSPTWH